MHTANLVVFHTFVGSWVISVIADHLANEIKQGPYYVRRIIEASCRNHFLKCRKNDLVYAAQLRQVRSLPGSYILTLYVVDSVVS